MNVFSTIATASKRNYITPEDVGLAVKTHPLHVVQRDLLAVIGKQVDLGIEDCGLCAFVAWRGSDAKSKPEWKCMKCKTPLHPGQTCSACWPDEPKSV
jgi:hypothetical protein